MRCHNNFTFLRIAFKQANHTSKHNPADKDKVVFDDPIATADPGTSLVRVKREKPDSPQASARAVTNPKSTPFPSMVRLGYLSQNQAVANTSKMAGKVLVRFQCSLCSKTFSRSGTLKVNVYFRTYTFSRAWYWTIVSAWFNYLENQGTSHTLANGFVHDRIYSVP